jgi:hypothetical protein
VPLNLGLVGVNLSPQEGEKSFSIKTILTVLNNYSNVN